MSTIIHGRIVRYNSADWVQQAEQTEIRRVKTLLRKKIYDKQKKRQKEISALDKLRNRRQFKIERRGNKRIIKHLWLQVPQDDGTFIAMRVAA